MTKIIIGTLLTCALATAGGDIAPIEEAVPPVVEEESGLKQKLAIYALIPSLDGSYIVNLPDDPSQETDFIDKLDMAFMASYELRDEKWAFFADFLYVDMSNDQNIYSPSNDAIIRSEQGLEAWMLSAYGGYNMLNDGDGTLDIIAGMRWLSINVDLALRSAPYVGTPKLSPSWDYYDAVIGVKGHRNINENWYIPYLFDVGAGDSDLTYQARAGIGYRYGWGDVMLNYRYIHYDNGKGGVETVEDLQLYGPELGVVFHF